MTAGPSSKQVVAAFDVDGTLTTRDCVAPFLRAVAGRHLVWALARRPLAVVAATVRRDNDRLKELATRSLRGRRAAQVDDLGRIFADHVRVHWLRPDTVGRLRAHQANGHRVVLVSASYEAYLGPLGAALGVDGVLCTRLDVAPDGRLTGRLDGPNCRGEEKVRRLEEWLGSRSLAEAEVWAYGDSPGDRELLARADVAEVVANRTIEAALPKTSGS